MDMRSLAVTADGERLVAGCEDSRIYVFDMKTGQLERTLEAHTEAVTGVSLSPDGQLLVSKGWMESVRLWRIDGWRLLSVLPESQGSTYVGITPRFHPERSDVLATFGEEQLAVRLWDLDLGEILANRHIERSVHYMTAKIALVGDSGVGKSGLGWRIAKGEFRPTFSTHGEEFWVVSELGMTRPDGTQGEVVLWDFAGQVDYRMIHALFLDDVDLGLILFDATTTQEPLRSAAYWIKHLQRTARPGSQILVGARIDRGIPALTGAELNNYCREHQITGGYVPTSAFTGEGVPELMSRIRGQIRWEQMSATVTTETFKRVKDFVLGLKEHETQRKMVKWPELRDMLQATDHSWHFSDSEMRTAVGGLQKHGYAIVLRTADEEIVLLFPELLAKLASSIVLSARADPDGLGALDEDLLRQGRYPLAEFTDLSEEERVSLLSGAVSLFLGHTICFRERLGRQTLLVFPELISLQPPVSATEDFEEDATYRVSGSVDHVYASLVVLLGYTNTFTRSERWAHRAQYEADGHICGFRQSDTSEDEIELVLYYGPGTPERTKLLFQGLFESYLSRADATINRFEPVLCQKCGALQQRNSIMDRLKKGKSFTYCSDCGARIDLAAPEERFSPTSKDQALLSAENTRSLMQISFEEALVQVKAAVDSKDISSPKCFISYALGDTETERWVERLAEDLSKAGVTLVYDQWDNQEIGASVPRFVSRIKECDYVLVIGTPAYVVRRNNVHSDDEAGYVLSAEADMIETRLTSGNETDKASILPLLVEGEPTTAFPPLLQGRVYAHFTDDRQYFSSLFDVILTVYRLMKEPVMRDLRSHLREQALI
jgi:hypothetical protein